MSLNAIPPLDVGMCSALAEDGQIRLTPATCKYPALLEVLVKFYRKHRPRAISFTSIQMSVDSCVAMHKYVADIGMQLVMCLGPRGRRLFADGIDGGTLEDHRLLVVPRCANTFHRTADDGLLDCGYLKVFFYTPAGRGVAMCPKHLCWAEQVGLTTDHVHKQTAAATAT